MLPVSSVIQSFVVLSAIFFFYNYLSIYQANSFHLNSLIIGLFKSYYTVWFYLFSKVLKWPIHNHIIVLRLLVNPRAIIPYHFIFVCIFFNSTNVKLPIHSRIITRHGRINQFRLFKITNIYFIFLCYVTTLRLKLMNIRTGNTITVYARI